MKKKDPNELAKHIVDQATGQKPKDSGKDPLAVELGRRGGKKGGPARADALSKEELVAIAKKGARARWKKKD